MRGEPALAGQKPPERGGGTGRRGGHGGAGLKLGVAVLPASRRGEGSSPRCSRRGPGLSRALAGGLPPGSPPKLAGRWVSPAGLGPPPAPSPSLGFFLGISGGEHTARTAGGRGGRVTAGTVGRLGGVHRGAGRERPKATRATEPRAPVRPAGGSSGGEGGLPGLVAAESGAGAAAPSLPRPGWARSPRSGMGPTRMPSAVAEPRGGGTLPASRAPRAPAPPCPAPVPPCPRPRVSRPPAARSSPGC